MLLRVAVSAVGRDEVNYPAECADRADPGRSRNKQPYQSDDNSAIVNLSESRNHQAQNPRYKWIAHLGNLLRQLLYEKPHLIVHKKVVGCQRSVVRKE